MALPPSPQWIPIGKAELMLPRIFRHEKSLKPLSVRYLYSEGVLTNSGKNVLLRTRTIKGKRYTSWRYFNAFKKTIEEEGGIATTPSRGMLQNKKKQLHAFDLPTPSPGVEQNPDDPCLDSRNYGQSKPDTCP